MNGKIDIAFIGVGTGGTVTGVAKKLKEKIPKIKIIGIDPIGSILALPEKLNNIEKLYKIEGLGQSEVPKILLREYVDEWIKTSDRESFILAR